MIFEDDFSIPPGALDWQEDAACRGTAIDDPTKFFPEKTMYARGRELREICGRCSVKSECLEWALDHEHYGMWGGTSEKERIVIRRRRRVGEQIAA